MRLRATHVQLWKARRRVVLRSGCRRAAMPWRHRGNWKRLYLQLRRRCVRKSKEMQIFERLIQTFINRDANFWKTHKKGMHVFKASIKPWCPFLKRSCKGDAFFFMTFINRDAIFWWVHKNETHIFKAFIKPWCILLKRSYKGDAIVYDLHKPRCRFLKHS